MSQTSKLNCWEFKKCGRNSGGINAEELGVCPAARSFQVNRTHGGKNGGRCCWAIAGTLCGGKVQGFFAHKYDTCKECDFYKSVHSEEGDDIVDPKWIIKKMS